MSPTVLVACDPASDDRSSVAFAHAVAAPLGARVSLVSVCAGDGLAGGEGDDTAPPRPEVRELRAASPAAGLQRAIEAERPALVVVGSAHGARHGRTGIGSTADRVLHGASCAVAVVPRGYPALALRSIAVGLLPTPDGLRALRGAAALARAAGAPLSVLAILHRSPDAADAAALAQRLAPGSAARGSVAATLRAAIDAAARAPDASPVFDAPRGRLVVDAQVLVGEPVDALLRATARAGLLVLGSRAYGPPGVVLPGGATLRVLGEARCPVLVVPRADVAAPVAALG